MSDTLTQDEFDRLFGGLSAGGGPKPYQISIASCEGCTILAIRGTVMEHIPTDFEDRLRELLHFEAGRRLLIDLSAVVYINSSAMGFLAGFLQASNQVGGQVLLVKPPDKVGKMLRLVGLDQFFLIVQDQRMGLDYFHTQQGRPTGRDPA